MSGHIDPIFELVEVKTGRRWAELDIVEPPTGKQYRISLMFEEFTGTVDYICQLLGYGRSYVNRPDGKVRLTLSVKFINAEMDIAILATPEEAQQLIKEFEREFRNMRRRNRYAAKKSEAAAFFPFMLQAA